ncbi:MAG: M1 family metallopeptidase [Dokdonella sp.]
MLSFLRPFLLLLFVVFPLAGTAKTTASERPTGKLPANAIPQNYALHLTIDPRGDRFSGKIRIQVRLAQPSDHVWLHAQAIDITSATITDAGGQMSPAQAKLHDDAGLLEVRFAHRVPAQDIVLAFAYNAPFNAQLEGLYKVSVGNDHYAISQMEPVSARFAFPGFDEPRFKTPFDISLTVPKDDVAIANTRQLREDASKDQKWKTLTFATTKPLPTYLVAFAVGPWDVVNAPAIPPNTVRKNAVPLRGIGPRGSAKKLAWILGETPAIVKFFEDYTAQPYPFDKLDLLGAPDFSAGAMENAGLIVFRDASLLLDAHSSADRYRSVFNVTAHELAHQWYGDLVTVPWWNDVWLNEAYATWAQAKASTALKPEYQAPLAALESRLDVMANDSLLSARKVRQPIEGHGDIATAFDGITYQKGAGVLAMFESWVGTDTFRAGMRKYLAAHAFGSGSSDDLIATLAAASGRGESFAKAMRSFLDQAGVPLIDAKLACNDGHASFALRQSRYLPYGILAKDTPLWRLPLCARFGRDGTSDTQCFLLDRKAQRFDVTGTCPDWVLPNADARGYYRFDLAAADLSKLGGAMAMLSAPEQLVYADALSSGFVRGTVSPGTLLDAMPMLAQSDMPQIATALLGEFEWIREHLGDARTRPLLDAYAVRLYLPGLQQLGYRRRSGEPGTATAMRTRLAEFLAMTVRDPAVRSELVKQGRSALGLDGSGSTDLTRADPDLLQTALKVTVQDGGAAAFDAALTTLAATGDTARRYALLAALGATRDATLGARARELGLTSAVQIGEMSSLYGAQIDERENRAAMWQWMQTHFDAYRERLSIFAQSRLPATVAEGRCSMKAADELAAFLAPHMKQLVGGERRLTQTLESVRQCAALREHLGANALADWNGTPAPAG